MEQSKNQKIKNWYINNRPLFVKLASKVESILAELIEENEISIHALYSRAKEIDSFYIKVSKKLYSNPEKEVHDLAGVRIITYVESDVEKVSTIVKKAFKIDSKNSVDKKIELGTDKVGYQSVHFIAELKADRLKLPEYKKFRGLKFELQIRTILQHAWAEIEHDRNYKFSGQLPAEIRRRFTVLAGSLELADREFNSIATEIDKISTEVSIATKEGKLNIPINSTTLNLYLEDKLQHLISNNKIDGFVDTDDEKDAIEHLSKFKIESLAKLDKLLTSKYLKNYKEFMSEYESDFHVLIANALLYKFHESFFEIIDPEFYTWIVDGEVSLQKAMGVPIDKIIQKYNL
jgi:ppGpp synthetase/RelA/SpoT-type nucleotidyltranferase